VTSIIETAENQARKGENKEMKKEGWGWPALSKKAHYFAHSLTSLCGHWLFGGSLEQGNDGSLDNCAACKRKLKKLRERTAND